MDVVTEININEIWQHNINFLIGSGASFGLFPTLETSMEGESIETLGKYFEDSKKEDLKSLLFIYYYKSCIEPVINFDIEYANLGHDFNVELDSQSVSVINNYKKLLVTISVILSKNNSKKLANIFTTNYDACFSIAFEEMLSEGFLSDFNLNDGSKGFFRKFVEVRNFDCLEVKFKKNGTSDGYIPQSNLVHLHGSAFWNLNGSKIQVDYKKGEELFDEGFFEKIHSEINDIEDILSDSNSKRKDFELISFGDEFQCVAKDFWERYKKLAIVNPTKWKFHETVFDEHYYQMLRLMSYELEKVDSVLIVFGFSFADEHITNLIKRSLGNKSLTMYVCCFDDSSLLNMKEVFKGFNNVKLVSIDGYLDFDAFNLEVFRLP